MLILDGANSRFVHFFAVKVSPPVKQDLASDCSARGILTSLKECGPQDAASLAGRLGITAPGIRQHLYELQKKGLVSFVEEPRPMGRPAKIWRLTEDANDCFPDNHAAVALNLLNSARNAFGPEGLCKLLSQYARDQVRNYKSRLSDGGDLRQRLEALASMRCEEGYMAEVREADDGALLLVENHCPISCAALSCSEFCDNELNMFREVLGREAGVERIEHMVDGHRRCVYRVDSPDQ
jgi:predicted ArsR family transcriptional regulator